ncbi:MAG: FIST C-terminal domain-containing protein [Alphaproteobacteria bacterium]|nr:FIST C-terminal domain-containing protein [Alphaproteobacteria bacterium]
MRVAVALSTEEDGIVAVQEAAQAARADVPQPVAALAWATGHHNPRLVSLRRALVEALGTRVIAGCVSAGITVGDQEVVGQPGLGLMVFSGPAERFEARLAHRLFDNPEASAVALLAGTGPDDLVVLMPTANHFKADPFLAEAARVAPDTLVVGGGATNPRGRDRVFDGDAVATDAAVALVIRGCRPRVGLTQSCGVISPVLTVTRCRGRAVFELDGAPAVSALAEVVQRIAGDQPDVRGVMAGLVAEPDGAGRRAFLVRPVAGVDWEKGTLDLGVEVDPGQQVVFVRRDVEQSRSDLNAMLLEHRALQQRPPAFGLWINCAGRGPAFQGMPDYDPAVIRGYLEGLPLGGFFGGFELAPLAGRTALHLFSGVLATGT